ncbi:hypothetical protein M8494_17210 [Serratia ureilytica]
MPIHYPARARRRHSGAVMDGVVDLSIIGENVLEEELLSRRAQGEDPRYCPAPPRFRRLPPVASHPARRRIRRPAKPAGRPHRPSYPHLLRAIPRQAGRALPSCLLNGSGEVAPRAGLADAICDLWSLPAPRWRPSGLREVEVIYRSKACLISATAKCRKPSNSDRPPDDPHSGRDRARESKYIMLHAPSRSWTRSSRAAGRRTPDHSAAGRRAAAWRCTW